MDPPYCYDPATRFAFLGPGVPLLFIFARLATLLLILLAVLFSIFALVSNDKGNNCVNSACSDSIFVRLSIANKIFDERSINAQNYLLVVFLVFYIFFLQYLIYMARKTDQRCD